MKRHTYSPMVLMPEPRVRDLTNEDPILARFTRDMVETLLKFFHAYQRDDVVTLQLTERGLWLVNPHNDTRQFLGQAVLTDAQRERIVREHRAQQQKKVN